MAFPQTPRVIPIELFVNGGWVDISSDVYARDSVVITRGRRDEQTRAEPSSCQLTIDNRSGNYSPRNPMGLYYGSLGRNTPIRVSVELATDTFTRTVPSGWGTADSGNTYTTEGGLSSARSTNGSRGLVSVTAANSVRSSIINGVNLGDVEVAFYATLPFDLPTGAGIMVFAQLRRQSITDYVRAWAQVQTDGTVLTGVTHVDGTIMVTQATVPGLIFTAAAGLNVRAQVEGQTWRVKVWPGAAVEPHDWVITGSSTYRLAAGGIAASAWLRAGNTNTLPVVASFDNVHVRVPRFTGEVSSWPQRWDVSGHDVYVPIEAAGIRRRLSQGMVATGSALYRFHKQLATPPIEYWPGEDPKNSPNQLTSTMGSAPLAPNGLGGVLGLSSDSTLISSAPLALSTVNAFYDATDNPHAGIILSADSINQVVSTGSVMFRYVLHIPFSDTSTPEPSDQFTIARLATTGTAGVIDLEYRTGGALGLTAYQLFAPTIYFASGPINFSDIRGRPLLINLQLTQVGVNTTYDLSTLEPGQRIDRSTWLHATGTIPNVAVNGLAQLELNGGQTLLNYSLGHVSLRSECVTFSDVANAFSGFDGEAAGVRFSRLCFEDGVSAFWRGDLTDTVLMGVQGVGSTNATTGQNIRLALPSTGQTLIDVLNECEDADMGILYESRGTLGLEYRTRKDLYSQTPVLILDYSLGQVAPPLEPVDDDQRTRNNIVVSQPNGLSAEAELLTGRMSTFDPSLGGVGQYNVEYTINAAVDELAAMATFLLSLGTVDEARYPTVTVNLANPNFIAAGLESSALAVNIGDRITIINPKTGVTFDTISQIVQGYTETLNVFEHAITFNTSPETPYRVAQVSATPTFKVDTTTSTLALGYSSTAASLSVNNVNEPWTTDPAQMPIPITVAGELMNVTAISGTSSPQTFTVTRSVNNVVKSQLAGAVVQIARLQRPLIGF